MLNKRTHILFDQETFDLLENLAKKERSSIGSLVRQAVQDKLAWEKRRKVAQKILQEKPIKITPYKASDLIHEGRRFE